MIEPQRYIRTPVHADAIQITEENLEEIAEWCGGKVIRIPEPAIEAGAPLYIKVKVHRPLTSRQTQAFVGDWVLYMNKGFKVYTPKAFAQSFKKAKDGDHDNG